MLLYYTGQHCHLTVLSNTINYSCSFVPSHMMLDFKNYIDKENVPECFPAVPAHAHVDRFPSSESGQEELCRLGCMW